MNTLTPAYHYPADVRINHPVSMAQMANEPALVQAQHSRWLGARAPSCRRVGLGNPERAMPKVEITVAFAAVLRKHRAAKGMSQDVLAEEADIHPTHVGCVVEHGQALAPKS